MSEELEETMRDSSAINGAWRIVTVAFAGDGGQATRDDGFGTDGLIIYGSSGYMTAHIVLPDRRESAASAAAQGGTGNPAHHAYFGTYTVDSVARTITHHRLANNNPGLPTDVVRSYRFLDNGCLVLSPLGGPGDQLTFERAGM